MHAPASLAPAFGVIRQCNPDLYAKMSASDWRLDAGLQADLTTMARGSEAVTTDDRCTYFSLTLTGVTAGGIGVPDRFYRAVVLAHEFAHTSQHITGTDTMEIERPAFAAMTAMAVTLPAPYGARITAYVDDILAMAERGETAYVVTK